MNAAGNGSFEQKVRAITSEWNGVLLTVLREQFAKHGQPVPELDEQELLTNAPRLLEDLTFPQGGTRNAFIVLTAPSGAGKGTVGKGLQARGIPKLPRVNTRPIRAGEAEGEEYFFVTDARFNEMKTGGEVFCATSTAEQSKEAGGSSVASTQAGIPTKEFDAYVGQGKPFFIDSGAGTAKKIKQEEHVQNIPFQVVFLLPPSFEEMIRRVTSRRAQEAAEGGKIMTDETLLDRLAIAVNHLRKSPETTDGYVVNDLVERAIERLAAYLSPA